MAALSPADLGGLSSAGAKTGSTGNAAGARPGRRRMRAVAIHLGIILLCLAGMELLLRIADFRQLRVMPAEFRYPYQHDPELGWVPTPNTTAGHGVRINGLGLRDVELDPSAKPTILFLGDSFVYGAGVRDGERFTDRLREELPDVRIVNAGVAAYGTDQEYLWLRRLWPRLEPSVVVLIVCVENDHRDNATNSMHSHTLKPYLAAKDEGWRFAGIPVPRGPKWYYYNNPLAEHSALVRLGVLVYSRLRYPPVVGPDPTTRLVGMMRDFVESRGAKFLVGLQLADPALEPYLVAEKIPYVRMDGVETLSNDGHWSPQGHATVARRLMTLLLGEEALAARMPAQ